MKQLLRRFIKTVRLAAHPVYRRGLRHGVGAAIEHEAALRDLDVRMVIDVGANKGQFSLLARVLFPGALIHAFEPLEEPALIFRRVFAGDTRAILHPVALGDKNMESAIHVSGRADSSSLLPILPRQESLFPGIKAVDTRMIPIRLGDGVLAGEDIHRPLLIKLDVQGYELAALRGMQALLAQADHVYAEICFQELYQGQVLAADLISWLQARHFRLAGIYNLGTDDQGQAVYADALFSKA